MRHPLSAARDRRSAKNGQYKGSTSGLATVLDEDVFEAADSFDLIETARDGGSIALDIDAD